MNPVLLDLGFIKIYWYSFILLLSIVTASFLLYKNLKKAGYDDDFFINLAFGTIIGGIIGARIYYVLFELDYYLSNPLDIIKTWNGGLAIHGAIIGGALWLIYYCHKKRVSFLKIMDMSVISLIIAQVIGRWGNFFNQEAHGIVTTAATLKKYLIPNFIIKGMYIDGNYYHPTFFYELLWNFLGFIILLILNKKCKLKSGVLTGIYLMWYSFIRFFIEKLRTDSLMLFDIRFARVISIVLFFLGLFLIIYSKIRKEVKYEK